MSENNKRFNWTLQLDWLNILDALGLSSIEEIPELKREKAIKKISKNFGDQLYSMDPSTLDKIVIEELNGLMKRELAMKAKEQEDMEREIREKMVPLKQGGIIRINQNDLKDLDPNASPEDILKYLYKKFTGKDQGEDSDEDDEEKDSDNYKEDNTGYYI